MSQGQSSAAQKKAIAPSAFSAPEAFSRFHVGVNLPWMQYGCDFGANAWNPHGGIGLAANSSRLAKILAEIRARDMHVVRWFVLCDGRAGVRFAADGTPLGLDDAFFNDADAALTVIRESGLRVVFVLFDFHWCRGARTIKGVRCGGHCATLRAGPRHEALFANVIEPILARYGNEPAIAAWDVMNEPEWVTFRSGSLSPLHTVSRAAMRSFLLQTTARIHGHTRQPATVGLASLRGLSLCRDIGLDFYQVHWYDKHEPRAPLATKIESLALDRPVVLGEFPTVNSRHSVGEILRIARTAGYGGAWCWSANAADEFTAGSLPILRV